MRRSLRGFFGLSLLLSGFTVAALPHGTSVASAATDPPGLHDVLVAPVTLPTAVAALPDQRLLVIGKDGVVTLIHADGTKAAGAAITLGVCIESERGGLGIEADPNFATNSFVYVYYTSDEFGCTPTSNGHNRVSRFTLVGETLGAEFKLVDNITSTAPNHDGGGVRFGPDGYLYISVGDGGTGGGNAHDFSNLKGKILRIASDGSIPPDNPFVGQSGATRCNTGPAASGAKCTEIYAYGLRNPFRFTFDSNPGHRAFVNDVGQDTTEEIDALVKGGDYGWPTYEGPCPQGQTLPCAAMSSGVIGPVAWYTHPEVNCDATTGSTSITGGAFVPNGVWPAAYDGTYLASDAGCQKIFLFSPKAGGGWARTVFIDDPGPVIDLEFVNEPEGTSLYYTTFANGGELHRVSAPRSTATTAGPGRFVPLAAPKRILDTRIGLGSSAGKPKAGSVTRLVVPSSIVPSDATAVALNVTGVNPDRPGFVRVWPAGDPDPAVSSLNFSAPGETIANAVISVLGSGRSLDLYTLASADLVVDISGYFAPATTASPGRFTPVTPGRLFDTRLGGQSPPAALSQFDVQVTGQQGVPATGVSAVALTITVTDPAQPGYVTVWPTGAARPDASAVNPTRAGETRANLVLIPVGAGGKVSMFTFKSAHLILDVAGWFTDGTAPPATTGLFQPSVLTRVTDSRQAGARLAPLVGQTSKALDLTPDVDAGAIAIAYNLTATSTSAPGYLTAYPTGTAVPQTSNVNFDAAGQSRASLTISDLSHAGSVSFFASASTDVILDKAGWFLGPTT